MHLPATRGASASCKLCLSIALALMLSLQSLAAEQVNVREDQRVSQETCKPIKEPREATLPEQGDGSQILPRLQRAGDALEARVRSGLADCPITRSKGFQWRVKQWRESECKMNRGERVVSWLPIDILRTFETELSTPILPISGANSRSLFYFALPGKEAVESSKALVAGKYPSNISTDENLDTMLKFFFAFRGNPQYQLTAVPGALTGAEDTFLYGNLGRMVYRCSCLTTAQAALEAQFSIPVVRVTSALDMAARSSRSTLVFYGTFQSPLWYMLSGERGISAEAEALLAIWNLHAVNQSREQRRYVTNFTGWLLLYVQGKEISANASVSGSSGASLGVGSFNSSAGSTFKMDESLSIESYELLIEPDTLQTNELPSIERVKERWESSRCASSIVHAKKEGDKVTGTLQIAGASQSLCARLALGATTADSFDKDNRDLNKDPRTSIGTPVIRDGVCEVPITLEQIPPTSTHAAVYLAVGKEIVNSSSESQKLSHYVSVDW